MNSLAPRRLLPIALASAGLLSVAWAQQQPTTLEPYEPLDGARSGTRPKFVVRAESASVMKLRFKIELSRDRFKTISYTFDQLKDSNGWAFTAAEGQEPGAIHFARQPIKGGDYLWRVASWDGLSWMTGPTEFRITVDDVSPAEVTGVRMTRVKGSGCVRVSWDSVVTDANGGTERIKQYHVYRYWERTRVNPIGPFAAGSTTDTEFEDCNPLTLGKPLVFYRVEAEDEAGNVFGRMLPGPR